MYGCWLSPGVHSATVGEEHATHECQIVKFATSILLLKASFMMGKQALINLH